jgi:hypothetical protein
MGIEGTWRVIAPGCVAWLLAACGGGGGGGGGTPPPPAPNFTIGGTVSGLAGAGLVLRNNGGDPLAVSTNGTFTFATALAGGAAYSVTVGTQPTAPVQNCSVASGTGSLAGANVSNVVVSCAAVPLTLASSTPAGGAAGVAVSAPIELTFSSAVSAATVTTGNITLRGPSGDHPVTLSVNGTRVTVTPTRPLRIASAYALSVATAVRGSAGEQVTAPISLQFTAADGAWAAATLLSGAGATANWPLIEGDAAGGAVVVWMQEAGPGTQTLAAAHSADGATWSAAAAVGGAFSFRSHDLVVDAAGAGTVAWQDGLLSSGTYSIWANRFTPGSGWSTAGAIETATESAASPRLAVEPMSGTVTAVWSQTGRLWSNRTTSGGVWGPPTTVNSSDTSNISSRSVGMDDAGNAIAVWDSGAIGQSVLNFNRFIASTGWGSFAAIATTGAGAPAAPQVGVDGAGNAIAVWGQHDGTRGNLWASRYTSGQGWSAAVSIETATQSAALSDLKVSADGHAIAVWLQTDGARGDVWAARYSPTTGWAAAELLEMDTVNDATGAVAVIDLGGAAHVAWEQAAAVQFNRYVPGTGWRAAATLAPGRAPDLGLGAQGRAFIAYVAGTTSPVRVRLFQ